MLAKPDHNSILNPPESLVSFFLFNSQASGKEYDVFGKNHGVITGGSWRSNNKGLTYYLDDTDYINFGGTTWSISNEFTIFMRICIRSNVVGVDYDSIIQRGRYFFPFAVRFTAGNNLNFATRTTAVNYLNGTSSLSLNKWYDLCFTRDNNGVKNIYIDGENDGTITQAGNLDFGSGQETILGKDYADGVLYSDIEIACLIMFNKALPAGQVKYFDPFGMFYRIKFRGFGAVISSLVIDVSETLTITEIIGENLPLAGISKFDNISIADIIVNVLLSQITKEITANELVSIIENINVSLKLAGISKYDNISIIENILLRLQISSVIFDNITIEESIQTILKLANISISEDITITEDIILNILAGLGISKIETISIIESIQLALKLSGIVLNENITITEDILITLLGQFAIYNYDEIAIQEYISLLINVLNISAYDEIIVNEFVLLILSLLNINVSELVNVTEFINLQLSLLNIASFENITITEFIQILFYTGIPVSIFRGFTRSSLPGGYVRSQKGEGFARIRQL